MLLGWLRPVPDFSVRQDAHASHHGQRSVGPVDGYRSRGFAGDGFSLQKRHRKESASASHYVSSTSVEIVEVLRSIRTDKFLTSMSGGVVRDHAYANVREMSGERRCAIHRCRIRRALTAQPLAASAARVHNRHPGTSSRTSR